MIQTLLVLLVTSILCSGKGQEYRVLISSTSQFKKEYLITEENLKKTKSNADKIKSFPLSFEQIHSKFARHFYDVQVPKISPKMAWPVEEFPEKGKYDAVAEMLSIHKMDVVNRGRYAFLVVSFLVNDLVTNGDHVTCCVFYLNGDIAEIVDPEIVQDE